MDLEYGLQWNGMDYGILCTAESTISHCILAFLSTPSEESPLLQVMLLAMYRIHMLKLSNYVTLDLHDFKDDA